MPEEEATWAILQITFATSLGNVSEEGNRMSSRPSEAEWHTTLARTMGDAKATALDAVESVLKTYQAILKQKPDAKAKSLDDLLKKQSQGKLNDALKQCP